MAFVAPAIIQTWNRRDHLRYQSLLMKCAAKFHTHYPDVVMVHIDCSIEILKARDTKGLYQNKAFLPEGHPERIMNLTVLMIRLICRNNRTYINTDKDTIISCTNKVTQFIQSRLKQLEASRMTAVLES